MTTTSTTTTEIYGKKNITVVELNVWPAKVIGSAAAAFFCVCVLSSLLDPVVKVARPPDRVFSCNFPPYVRCCYFPIDREHLRFSPIVCVRHRNAATVVQTSKSIKEIDLKIPFGEADTVEILRGQASSLTGILAHENRATEGRLKAEEIVENISSTRSRRSGMNGK